ncbi:hypothetical protein ACFLXY_08800 [Chloroflexota bacterium]
MTTIVRYQDESLKENPEAGSFRELPDSSWTRYLQLKFFRA